MTAVGQVFGLPDRGVIAIKGVEARSWLDNLVSNDLGELSALATKPAVFAGLLSPQGKILFEFLVISADDGVLLETSLASVTALIKRLTLYKLRAQVALSDVSGEIMVVWAEGAKPAMKDMLLFEDPRVPSGLLWRGVVPRTAAQAVLMAGDYAAARVRIGLAQAPEDYALGDTFPHEANYDLCDGVSFSKGCYVGQEVVSRMQNKSVVRKRVVRVHGEGVLLPGSDVRVGEAVIGKVGTVAGRDGLAMLRLDRVAEALENGGGVHAGGVAVTVDTVAVEAYRQQVKNRPVVDL
jgi:tRNA-modifying protein YgfZ